MFKLYLQCTQCSSPLVFERCDENFVDLTRCHENFRIPRQQRTVLRFSIIFIYHDWKNTLLKLYLQFTQCSSPLVFARCDENFVDLARCDENFRIPRQLRTVLGFSIIFKYHDWKNTLRKLYMQFTPAVQLTRRKNPQLCSATNP